MGSKKWRFSGKMLNYGFGSRKRHIPARNCVFWRFVLRQSWCRRLGCRWSEKSDKTAETRGARNRACADTKPFIRSALILHKITYKFWLRSVTGFLGGGGSYFPVLHRFSSSPLQHSRAAVRGCDLRSPRGVATVIRLRTFARFVRGRRGVMSHTC